MRAGRLLPFAVAALLACPGTASAQKDQFFEALLSFYQALAGVYGNEGPELTARLDTLSAALERWDRATTEAEQQLRSQEKDADAQTAIRVHTMLGSIYIERRRFNDALAEFDQDIRIDPK